MGSQHLEGQLSLTEEKSHSGITALVLVHQNGSASNGGAVPTCKSCTLQCGANLKEQPRGTSPAKSQKWGGLAPQRSSPSPLRKEELHSSFKAYTFPTGFHTCFGLLTPGFCLLDQKWPHVTVALLILGTDRLIYVRIERRLLSRCWSELETLELEIA